MTTSILSTIFTNPLLGLIILIAAIFLAWNLTLHWQIYQTRKKIKAVFKGTKVADLEGVIFEQIKRLRQAEKNIEILENFTGNLETMAQKNIQKVGIVRFNPFKDTGGDQSFSVACLDGQNNGFTLSGLFTREGTRIYAKPIINSESEYPLTGEEKKAIEAAQKNSQAKFKFSMTNVKSNPKSK